MENLAKLYILSDEEENALEVSAFLDRKGIGYEKHFRAGGDVQLSEEKEVEDEYANDRLPVFEWPDGGVLQLCTVQKLVAFLHDRGVQLEDS